MLNVPEAVGPESVKLRTSKVLPTRAAEEFPVAGCGTRIDR